VATCIGLRFVGKHFYYTVSLFSSKGERIAKTLTNDNIIIVSMVRAGFSLKMWGLLPNIRIARPNSHYTHSDSVVIIDILLRTRIT